jgi:cytochrome c-type biogenesis protein CcmH/NrfG
MDVELSTAALERALAINPLDTETWSQLGHNRQHSGDLAGATTAFETVDRLAGGSDFAALASLASLCAAQEAHGAALQHLQAMLALGAPPSPTAQSEMLGAQHNAALALIGLGQHEDAGLVLEGVIEADPDASDSWAALGVCMAQLGQHDAALACQRQVMRLRAEKQAGGG